MRRATSIREKIFERAIKADVAVEIAIDWIARITFRRAPDLSAAIAVTSERSRTVGGVARSIDGLARARLAENQAVRIENEPAQVRLLHDGFEA